MSGRHTKDWLDAYLQYTEQTEPPLSYHTWVGLALVSGALQRRCKFRWGFETLYPNLYVILVGPSGKARKGVAIGIGKKMFKHLTLPITSENITREALIRAMKASNQTFPGPSGIEVHSSIITVSEELSVFLGQSDIRFLASLTDWYDSHDEWSYETKGGGKDYVPGVCMTLLGATAPDWIQSMLPQEAVGGGFTSRVIFIVEDRKGKSVSRPVFGEREQRLEAALLSDLEKISVMYGEFKFTKQGEDWYVNWYEQYEKQLESGKMPVDDPRFAGYCERRATHLRKVSMLMSACRGSTLLIEAEDLARADSVLKAAEIRMSKTFGGLGSAQYSIVTEKVKDYIQRCGSTTRSQVLRVFYRDADSQVMKIIEEVLVQMKVIRMENALKEGEMIYHWIGEKK